MLKNLTSLKRALETLCSAQAVTIVGANERGGTTRLILDSLRNPACAFPGRINLVNRRGETVYGLPSVASVSEIDGDPGIAWMLVGGEHLLPTLKAFRIPPRAVIAFAGGFREVGNEASEIELAEWSHESGVPLFGPQSIGFAYFAERLNALDLALKYQNIPGDIAVMAQSGGVLSGMLGALSNAGLGVRCAFSLGNEAAINFCALGAALLEDEKVRAIAVYAESIRSTSALASLAARAAQAGKPIVLLHGAKSETGKTVARSHTGAISTSTRLVEGIARQFGVVIVRDLDRMVMSLKVFGETGYQRFGAGGVGIFSNSAAANVLTVDAMTEAGIRLPEVSAETRRALVGEDQTTVCNPYDCGGGMLGRQDEFSRRCNAFAADPNLDILVHVVPHVPAEPHAAHVQRVSEFDRAAKAAGKLSVLATLFQEATIDRAGLPQTLLAAGTEETITKIDALSRWSRASVNHPIADGFSFEPLPRSAATHVVTGPEVQHLLLASSGFDWPRETLVEPLRDPREAISRLQFPLVAKAEAGLAHRAKSGGVITGIEDMETAVAAVAYLRKRFGSTISLHEHVSFEDEYFIGASRTDEGLPVLAVGPGGAGVEQSDGMIVQILPLSQDALIPAQAPSGLASHPGAPKALLAVASLLLSNPAIAAIDLNPVVIGPGGGLTVLDGKIHLRA